MDIEIIISALIFGLFTSFHCAGMCGPIAVALPLSGKGIFTKIFGSILYNIGRAITYAFIGAIFGLVGQGFVLGGFQQSLSIVMGVIMIISVFFPSLFKDVIDIDKTGIKFVARLREKLALLFTKQNNRALFLIGILNGFLPCAPVYAALAGATATGSFQTGSLFMFIFGLGTLPMLLTISVLGNIISADLRRKIAKMVPVTIVIIGLLFIMRGLGLGIPFLSPPEDKLHVPEKMELMKMDHNHKKM